MKVRLIHLFVFFIMGYNYAQKNNIQTSNQRIEAFNNEQGFYQNSVNAIVSDSKGYLWIATPNGLVRNDGYSFEYFYHKRDNQKSLPNNYITNLLSDSNGRLWIGTRGGLCVYLTDKEQFIPIENSIKQDLFIKEDSQQRIWVGNDHKLDIYSSSNNDLDTFDKIAEINFDKAFDGSPISDIEFLSDSELLVSTSQSVYKVDFDENSNFSIGVIELKLDTEIPEIKKIIKIDNSLWIGTISGIYHTFHENSRLITLGEYFKQQHEILSLYLDKEKKLWIGTKRSGIIKYDVNNAGFISFRHDSKYINGLTSDRINAFFEDDFGVVWIGTAQGGLCKFDKNQKPFQNYAHNAYDNQSLSSNLITDLTEDDKGRIWISFFESPISRTKEYLNLKSDKHVIFERLEKKLNTLNNQWVLRFFKDIKGYWWVSTNEGIYLYDEQKDHLFNVRLKIEEELVDAVFNRVIEQLDANKIILAGSHVYLLNDPWSYILKGIPVEIDKGLYHLLKEAQINDYLKDSSGNYWFVSTKGVFRIISENGKWILKNHLTTSSEKNDALKLSHNHILTIHAGSNKDLWLGTFGGGLMRIDLNPLGEPENIKSYQRNDGLRDEVIYGILEDDKEQLWLSTDMGICCFNPVLETFDFYDVNNGILSNNFRQSAFLKTKQGIMLMGGVGGLTIFDPNEIKNNKVPPKILISSLKINNQPIVPGEKINNKVILERSISDTNSLVVEHENRNISLDIIVQHSATPNKNKLAYMLEGVNKDWIEIDGGKTTATYTNLSPGTYNFLYKGANGDGVWALNTENFTIQVLAPWYSRWWSIALFMVLVLAITYTVFRYLVRLEKLNQELKYEQIEKERVEQMNQSKLRFFTNISHDFKTPLSLIIGPLEKIAEQNKGLVSQKYFSIIQNNISRLQRLIDQLISYRKAETGHLELKYTKTTLGDFIYPLIEGLEDYADRTLLNFTHKVDNPNRVISLDVDKTERILLNLFTNAVKYSDSNREVSIEVGLISDEDDTIFIQVANTGVGIPMEKLDRIFDRFYRGVDDDNDWSGTGIGLSLCKSLVDLMQGTITVTSDPEEKTIFRVTLPIADKGITEEETNPKKYKELVTDWLPKELEEFQNETINTSRPTILIIDDEQGVRSFLYESFKSNYNVILAIDGEDGFKKLNEISPQLVISDVMMPKVTGYELCYKIKSSAEFCHIPVILLTAHDDSVRKMEGLELGADDYIVKPFSIKYLEVRVKTLIENKQRIFEYFSSNSLMPKDSLISSSRDKQFLEKINISIEKNMANSAFGVEELAGDMAMSTSHFYRRLKELTGQAPNVYLRNFRLHKAAELLKANKTLSASDVMFEIGIESKSYYSSAFKKIHGFSPSEFVKKI